MKKWLKKMVGVGISQISNLKSQSAECRGVYVEPMTVGELEGPFVGMNPGTPVVRSVLHILRSLAEEEIVELCGVKTPGAETERHSMRISAFREAEGKILMVVDSANRPKAQTSSARKSTGSPK